MLLRQEPRACAWLGTQPAPAVFLKGRCHVEGSGSLGTRISWGKGCQDKCRTPSQIQISNKQSIISQCKHVPGKHTPSLVLTSLL